MNPANPSVSNGSSKSSKQLSNENAIMYDEILDDYENLAAHRSLKFKTSSSNINAANPQQQQHNNSTGLNNLHHNHNHRHNPTTLY